MTESPVDSASWGAGCRPDGACNRKTFCSRLEVKPLSFYQGAPSLDSETIEGIVDSETIEGIGSVEKMNSQYD